MLVATAGFALAANQGGSGAAGAMHNEEMIYGSQMMTEQERLELRERMRAAETNEERERIRLEHHERMQERAKEQGLRLPDMPPEHGGGMGKGMGGGKRQNR
ncbi:MAG: hypothetical protein P8Y73_10095 [Desulfuromonadales bacterium]